MGGMNALVLSSTSWTSTHSILSRMSRVVLLACLASPHRFRAIIACPSRTAQGQAAHVRCVEGAAPRRHPLTTQLLACMACSRRASAQQMCQHQLVPHHPLRPGLSKVLPFSLDCLFS